MAGIYSLYKISAFLGEFAGAACPDWQSNAVQNLLFIFDFSPLFVMGALFIVSIVLWDVFTVGLTLVVYLDWGVNLFFNYAIVRQIGPQGSDCIYTPYQNPAYNVEQIAVIFTMYACLGMACRTWRIPWYTMVLVALNTSLLISNHVYRRVNTTEAVLTGGLLGMADGFIGFTILYHSVPYLTYYLDHWAWIRWMGLRNWYFRKRAPPESAMLALVERGKLLVDPDSARTDWLRLCLGIWMRQMNERDRREGRELTRMSLLAQDLERELVFSEQEEEFCGWMAAELGPYENNMRRAMEQTLEECTKVWREALYIQKSQKIPTDNIEYPQEWEDRIGIKDENA